MTDSGYRFAATSPLEVASLFSLAGRTAVVTGGSRGIGYMIASGLVANGVRTIITARKAEACDDAAGEINGGERPDGGECISIPADVSTGEGVEAFVTELRGRLGADIGVDLLVNNAGAAWGAPLGEFPESGFDKVMDVNMKAPFLLTQALLPELDRTATHDDPARVIMIGSIDGIRVPVGDNYSYSAAKAGVHMLARHLGAHLATRHITVNSIAPGPFPSKMMAYRLATDEMRNEVASHVPRGRVGTPEDIVGAVVFLASRAGAYTSGAVVPVDGGISTLGAV
ncbi:MAG: SDR family oxidoreductase [Actinomycetota bacterium]